MQLQPTTPDRTRAYTHPLFPESPKRLSTVRAVAPVAGKIDHAAQCCAMCSQAAPIVDPHVVSKSDKCCGRHSGIKGAIAAMSSLPIFFNWDLAYRRNLDSLSLAFSSARMLLTVKINASTLLHIVMKRCTPWGLRQRRTSLRRPSNGPIAP